VSRSRIAPPVPKEEVRFEFGNNWRNFLTVFNDDRLRRAEESLITMLGMETLAGKRFLDIGCGSGLFSLAARRLGAEVTSFDVDSASVACTVELKRRYYGDDPFWIVARASVLDSDYLQSLGTFDVVYSWGVLHHTGAMWTAVENALRSVRPRGQLFIALYNDQGAKSRWWVRVKRTYNRLPARLKPLYMLLFGIAFESAAVLVALARLNLRNIVNRWTKYENVRGMSRWHDVVDWVGGYPFEVATPDAVSDFCRRKGFDLVKLKTCGGKLGCNEFVFERNR